MTTKITSKAQIVATIGPASENLEILTAMMKEGMDIARINFSWAEADMHANKINLVRAAAKAVGRHVPIIADLSGPRIQAGREHEYDEAATSPLTPRDLECMKAAVDQKLDYIALSYVGSADDIHECRAKLASMGGKQPIIAKIERAKAVDDLYSIIAAADAVMVARGDLGNDVPLERIPFIQADIIHQAKAAGKPVITATQMLLSMTEKPEPTRAEVTDVANAILRGSDAVMLSEESASGKYPVEAVRMMERIVIEAERHIAGSHKFNLFT